MSLVMETGWSCELQIPTVPVQLICMYTVHIGIQLVKLLGLKLQLYLGK